MTPSEIAKGLSKENAPLLVEMAAIMAQDAPRRMAFVDGFNERRIQRYAGTTMRANYELGRAVGLAVRAIIEQESRGE